MKRVKQIVSIICVIGFLNLYIITLISAFFTTPATAGLFKACIFSTVAIPVFLYAYLLIYRILKNNNQNHKNKEENTR